MLSSLSADFKQQAVIYATVDIISSNRILQLMYTSHIDWKGHRSQATRLKSKERKQNRVREGGDGTKAAPEMRISPRVSWTGTGFQREKNKGDD